VAREIVTDAIAGYYTLAAGSVLLTRMPQTLSKKLPRYPDVPVARLGRLAVGQKFQGRKLGAALLWDAIERAARSEVVVYEVVVDAKDGEAAAARSAAGQSSRKPGQEMNLARPAIALCGRHGGHDPRARAPAAADDR
jgi:GNAT superfamily N-acetyltransferase